MSVFDIPLKYDETGKLQHSLKTKEVVLCLCYQPPNIKYHHPNIGSGTYSQAVYVVGGSYVSYPAFRSSGLDRDTLPEDILYIKAGDFVNLEHLKNVTLHDTAGPTGVMMIHINPVSGQSDFDFHFIGPNQKQTILTNEIGKTVFCFKEEVIVNGVELSLLNRVRLKHNTSTIIETGNTGACLIMTRRNV
ncbi:MAG: hypothetical protein ABFD07_18225 [Methanobacterium sp.]